jgi:hypothetical protein
LIISGLTTNRVLKLLDKGVGLIDAVILLHGIKSQSKIWTLEPVPKPYGFSTGSWKKRSKARFFP